METTEILSELREIKELLCLNQPVLSFRQFCKFADLSEAYAYKLTSSGAIKFYKPFGKKVYIDREEAIWFLKQNPSNGIKNIERQVSNYFLTTKQ